MPIELYMIWIWLGIFILTFVIEAVTQELASIWFTLGSLVSMILSLINGIPYWVEIIVFVVVSVLTLILTRPVIKKMFKSQIRNTNVDDIVGREVIALSKISKDINGEIKINDIIYTAVLAEGEEDIDETEHCVIVSVKGNKMIVRKNRKEL